eukprot:jgi/Chlat1/2992/Chrsp2S04707
MRALLTATPHVARITSTQTVPPFVRRPRASLKQSLHTATTRLQPSPLLPAAAQSRRCRLFLQQLTSESSRSQPPVSFSTAPSEGTVAYLRHARTGTEIYLVGTAHVSQKSADEVREVIRRVKPDVVMVELDAQRAAELKAGKSPNVLEASQAMLFCGHASEATMVVGVTRSLTALMRGLWGPGGLQQRIIAGGLSSLYAALRRSGMDPGLEFKASCVAIEEAKKLGAKLIYGDRDARVTTRRLGQVVSMWDLLRAGRSGDQPVVSGGASTLTDMVEEMKTRAKSRQIVEQMTKVNPEMVRVLITERDEHMARVLREAVVRHESRVAVAVMGLAHVDGVEQCWQEAEQRGE